MGLFSFVSDVLIATVHDGHVRRLDEHKATGLTDEQAGAPLILEMWGLPTNAENLGRAYVLSKNLGSLVIGFLMFTKRIGLTKELKASLVSDPSFHAHGSLQVTALPLVHFATQIMNRIWNNQRLKPGDENEAAFAAFYATLVSPIDVAAWLILEELKRSGFCPEIDTRDHAKEGIAHVTHFLQTAKNPDPKIVALLNQGLMHLRAVQAQSRHLQAVQHV